jgi:hypothetical protein
LSDGKTDRSGKIAIVQIGACASKARVWSIMRPYVEAMAADAA